MNAIQSRAAATQQLLLDVTETILVTEGYAALNEEYLCKNCKVSRGALRYHFPAGRYDLLKAFAERVVAGQAERLGSLDGLCATDRVYLALMSLQHKTPSASTLALLELWMASRGDMQLAQVLEPSFLRADRQLLGDDADPNDATLLALRIIIQGASMHACSSGFVASRLQAAIAWILQQMPPPKNLTAKLPELNKQRGVLSQPT